jgi:hypothetical protein
MSASVKKKVAFFDYLLLFDFLFYRVSALLRQGAGVQVVF